jgi:imidazolonepropionase
MARQAALSTEQSPGGDLNVINAAHLARVTDRGAPRRGREQAELDLVRDGAVAIRDGVIVAVGRTEDVMHELGDPAVPVIDASGKTVLPGLVESHCHPLFKPAPHPPEAEHLDLELIAGREDGIWETVQHTRAASDEQLLAQLARVYDRALAGGVTTLETKTGYSLDVECELRDLRLLRESAALTPIGLVSTFLGAHMVPADEPDAGAYVDTVLDDMLPRVVGEHLAEFGDFCCDADLFEPALVAKMLERAQRDGLPVRIHADGWGAADGWRTAVRYGARSADHLTFTSDEDILEVGRSDTIATLLPVAELIYLTERRANARGFIDQEVPVAIATDYCSSIGTSSLITTVGLAVPWFRISPAEAIVGATLNAAYSLDRGADTGSLDIGKRGDLTILDVAHPNDVYLAVGAPLIDAVVIGGRLEWSARNSTDESPEREWASL